MTGVFSLTPLENLIASRAEVVAVILPAAESGLRRLEPISPPPSDLPILNPHFDYNIIHLAWRHNIPVWEVDNLAESQTFDLLASFQPDLMVVACFSHIFPPSLLQLPRYGCLNLHPSLLPAYRGPAPLFWMARHGQAQAGVTLHFLDEGIDSGDIISQTTFVWPEGRSEAIIEQRCAELGGQLLVEAVHNLRRQGTLPRRLQPEAEASYLPWPAEDDFRISTDWTAQRAFNFIRFAEDNWPLWFDVDDKQVFIRIAISYDPDKTMDHPLLQQDDDLFIQFNPGVLRVRPRFILPLLKIEG